MRGRLDGMFIVVKELSGTGTLIGGCTGAFGRDTPKCGGTFTIEGIALDEEQEV